MVGEKSNYDRVQQTPEDGTAALRDLAVVGWPSDGGPRPGEICPLLFGALLSY